MPSLARKSRRRPSTDTQRSGARLSSPHTGMTKAPHTSQCACGIRILPTPPSPFPTSDTCSCTATQNLPQSSAACSSACIASVLVKPRQCSNHFWPELHPNSYHSLACLVFRSCSLHLPGRAGQVHWKCLGSSRLPMVGVTGEDAVNASWCCCD